MSSAASGEGTKVLIRAESNLGYGVDDVEGNSVTLECLLKAVKTAIEEWGEQAEVVLFQTNNRYGANYGRLSQWDIFAAAEGDEDEEEDE